VARLVRTGADIDLQDNNGSTALHFAAQEQRPEVVKLLLDAGADIEKRDKHGATPLMHAVFYYRGDGDTLVVLRARGANPLAENNYGISPVRLARQIANYDVAKYFDDVPKQ
jgi:ankyrin repeat protein